MLGISSGQFDPRFSHWYEIAKADIVMAVSIVIREFDCNATVI